MSSGAGAGEREPPTGAALQGVLEIIPGGVVHVGADGSIRYANAQALEVLGFSYDRITQRYAQDFEPETIHPDGSPCAAADYPVVRALTTGRPQPPMTIGVRRPDGALRWAVFSAIPLLDRDGAITGALASFLDVTELRRTEAALHASEARMRAILESAPNVIISTDVDGLIRFVNRTVPELTPAALIGAHVATCVAPGSREVVVAALRRAVAERSVVGCEAAAPFGRAFEVAIAPVIEGEEVTGLTGGDIEVESVEGRGSTFRVVLPAAAPEAALSPVPGPPRASQRRGRILIVDDERLIRESLAHMFDRHEVVTCASGREALAILSTGAFDLVLCDLIMPDVTGMELFEAVRRDAPELCDHFVFMSGGAFTERSVQFRRQAPCTFVDKPFDLSRLSELVEQRIGAAR